MGEEEGGRLGRGWVPGVDVGGGEGLGGLLGPLGFDLVEDVLPPPGAVRHDLVDPELGDRRRVVGDEALEAQGRLDDVSHGVRVGHCLSWQLGEVEITDRRRHHVVSGVARFGLD